MQFNQRIGQLARFAALSSLVLCGVLVSSDGMATHTVTKTEDVRQMKHYFVANTDVQATGTSEVCVFCHTPHGAAPNVQGGAPLWNRKTHDSGDFTPYSAPNFDAAGQTPGQPKGVSLACLSCHDGVIAIDALINAPGSGGFLEANRASDINGGTSVGFIDFLGPGIQLAPDSSMTGDESTFRDATDTFTTVFSPFSGGRHDMVTNGVTNGAKESMTPFPNLGLNLTDDHPVGMAVPADGFDTHDSIRDPQFAPIGANSPPPAIDGHSIKFITRSAGIMPTDIRDRLRAYPVPNVGGTYYVECATCHNPHTPRVNLLRLPSYVPGLVEENLDPTTPIVGGIYDGLPWAQVPNNGSAICLSCHAK
jgi:cytochrome c553